MASRIPFVALAATRVDVIGLNLEKIPQLTREKFAQLLAQESSLENTLTSTVAAEIKSANLPAEQTLRYKLNGYFTALSQRVTDKMTPAHVQAMLDPLQQTENVPVLLAFFLGSNVFDGEHSANDIRAGLSLSLQRRNSAIDALTTYYRTDPLKSPAAYAEAIRKYNSLLVVDKIQSILSLIDSFSLTPEQHLVMEIPPNYPQSVYVHANPTKRDKTLLGPLADIKYQSLHWGQRKLLLNEVYLLSKYTDPSKQYIVLYVGAAPGNHLPFLLELFPNITLHLYDPAKFDRRFEYINRAVVHTGPGGFFDDKKAELYRDSTYQGKKVNLVYLSDIRLTPDESKVGKEGSAEYEIKFDEQVRSDMLKQMRWAEIMSPDVTMLKLRFPYPRENVTDFNFEYLQGHIMIQPWDPVTSTEARLIVPRPAGKEYPKKVYDIRTYEQQFAYYNNQVRLLHLGKVKLSEMGIRLSGTPATAGGEEDVTLDELYSYLRTYMPADTYVCSDYWIEAKIWYEYMQAWKKTLTVEKMQYYIEKATLIMHPAAPDEFYTRLIEMRKGE